ncbi:MAG TPA: EAL domain-containing protein [Nocardioidaceae bacterium]|nr:EAL domain-containing protein [Nocardioidaceae bacterium]
MHRPIRSWYFVVMVLLAGLYFTIPAPPRYLWTLIGCTSVAAIVAGLYVHRPRNALPWWLFAAGTATFIAGDSTYDLLVSLGHDNLFPSVADVLYLCTYPLFAGGLLLVVRARWEDRDRAALLDALIVTIGAGLLVWVFLAAPYTHDGTMTVLEKSVSIAYPLGDVLLLAVLARLLIGRGVRSWSLRWLTLGTIGLLTADVFYGLIQLNGTWETGGPVDIGWICFYVAWGAAALEPDMVDLAEPVRLRPLVMSPARLFLLGSVSLLPPTVLIYEGVTYGAGDVVVNALACAALFLLVTVRLSGVVDVARQSTERESVLRRTGESLVGASSKTEIYAAGARAVAAMTGEAEGHRVLIAIESGTRTELVYDSGAPQSPSDPTAASEADVTDLLERHAPQLQAHSYVLTNSSRSGAFLRERLGPDVPVLLAGLGGSGTVTGVVAVAGHEIEQTDIIDAVCAMSAQLALALDSADLTEEMSQRKNEAHFRSLIQNTSDIILVVDADLMITYGTPSVQSVLGHEASHVLNHPFMGLVSKQDAAKATLFLRRIQLAGSNPVEPAHVRPDDEWHLLGVGGTTRTFEVTCSNLLHDPVVQGLVLTLHDTTERQALEEELKHLAFHDALTHLPNRTLFLDRVEHALSRQGRHRERLAVMLIDLDDFKMVNDTRGHAAGDALLVAVSERLQGAVRPEDTCARLGGDEFAVLVEGLIGDEEAEQLADRILAALRPPFGVGDDEVSVRASIGMSTSDYGAHAPELLIQADLAMYAAKDAGKSQHKLYRPSLQHVMQSRLSMVRDLQRALDEGQFVLHYQPVLNLGSGHVVGTEALLRWQHPVRGLVFPGEFIDAVEGGDLAVPVGTWVLETAIAQAVSWQPLAGGGTGVRMSVNVAPRQLADPAFVDIVTRALVRHGLPSSALTVEITERTLTAENPQIVSAMEQLKGLGVGLAIDDFGTGYAALGYLRRFPVTTLKIDQSFVNGVDKSTNERSLVEAIIRLGETFGLDLVAEGIETPSQRDALRAMGCEQGQGFLYARGLSVPEIAAYIQLQSGSSIKPVGLSPSP